ncbi:MAG: 5-oxoprolinase subunit PxpB [bacterium]|nr:5-oxoprolinase subunit PxpB [bacterium]
MDDFGSPKLQRIGERALALSFDGVGRAPSLELQARVWSLAERAASHPMVVDALPGMGNLTLFLRDPDAEIETLGAELAAWCSMPTTSALAGARTIEIPVRYGGEDGPDLAAVAAHCGMSEAEVIRLHASAEYVVFFLGFQPGFAYLGGLDPRLATPRRATPRTVVPAGSVGIAGLQTGIYPQRAPGGWQLIGRTETRLFDWRSDPPALLRAGDRVRFVAARA